MGKKIRVGLIGCGVIGGFVLDKEKSPRLRDQMGDEGGRIVKGEARQNHLPRLPQCPGCPEEHPLSLPCRDLIDLISDKIPQELNLVK